MDLVPEEPVILPIRDKSMVNVHVVAKGSVARQMVGKGPLYVEDAVKDAVVDGIEGVRPEDIETYVRDVLRTAVGTNEQLDNLTPVHVRASAVRQAASATMDARKMLGFSMDEETDLAMIAVGDAVDEIVKRSIAQAVERSGKVSEIDRISWRETVRHLRNLSLMVFNRAMERGARQGLSDHELRSRALAETRRVVENEATNETLFLSTNDRTDVGEAKEKVA